MTHGALFGGIAGFCLAAQWVGIENVWYNDNEKYVCDVVRARITDGQLIDKIKIHEKDIREIGKHNLKRVDIISGGFPCQPFSAAGKRKGKSDDRYLWPEMLRIISEIQPTYVIGENVAGLLSMENGETLKGILSDLENEGYNNEIFLIPACGVGAWHRRERIWIVSHANSNGNKDGLVNGKNNSKTKGSQEKDEQKRGRSKNGQWIRSKSQPSSKNATNPHNTRKRTPRSGTEQYREKIEQDRNDAQPELSGHGEDVANPPGIRQQRQGKYERSINSKEDKKGQANRLIYDSKRKEMQWNIEPSVGRVATGIPNRVDRLKGLGNAIAPQVAYELFKAIKIIDETT
ncbi:MAG: DNA (cytosine-5-)-methyltransferase [Candidatus Anammoxibacter sp.]